ncbi:MAG: sugar transferase, partial [Deltaproteobacteria bacterium]|nr:sugar transferase [Deltaproteobacteria bacterium]
MKYYAIWKRVFDLFLALPGLILLSPLLLVIGTLVAINYGRSIFFIQTRPGLKGQPFKILKFRTMTDAGDSQDCQLSDADRLTSFGRFLRSTSLDELPELINVIKGDMSLVGPRPLLVEYLQLYSAEQARRHEVRPGITGWAQVKGRNTLSWDDKFKLDIWYVDNQSFLLDLKILFMTVITTICREGINADGEATMSR